MFAVIARIALQVLAGLGIGKILDKTAADKIPAYQPAGVLEDETGKLNIPKIAWFVVAMVAGAMLTKFIGKKLNIKLLK